MIAVDSVGFMLPPNADNILKVCDHETIAGKTNLQTMAGRLNRVSVRIPCSQFFITHKI